MYTLHCVSEKRHTCHICDNLVRCHPILPILGGNIPGELETTHAQPTKLRFLMFVLYLVNAGNDFTSYISIISTASNMKFPYKSPIVKSDVCQVKLRVIDLSKRDVRIKANVQIVDINSHTGARGRPAIARGRYSYTSKGNG